MKTILVPVDFSDVSTKVAQTASVLATAFCSRVILVNVAEPEPEFVGYDPGPLTVRVAVAHDGALLVTEDGNGTLWRVSYSSK